MLGIVSRAGTLPLSSQLAPTQNDLRSRLSQGMFHIIPKASATSRVLSGQELGSRPYETKRRRDWLGIRWQGARGISAAVWNPGLPRSLELHRDDGSRRRIPPSGAG